ncbi:outer membrane beta-barrel protein [Pedobacter sp. SYSU D00535]|uniref:outer membrane beta-barrel protein n=1 Tax=Pedobacter sp. SYSU D00535 TaxID=2810308 RepID=UPI001A964E54|nr:outer membrane beta-barrel protein [Pedobacter sp. SYSU D00535]
MKKIFLSVALLLGVTIGTRAQLSNLNLGLSGTYTSYGGDVDKATPGLQFTAGYAIKEKLTAVLGFNYGFPIKQSFSDEGFSFESKTTFTTLSLSALYHLVGTTEDNFSLYVPVGAALVTSNTKMEGNGGGNGMDFEMEADGKLSGLTLNAGLGAQFKVGVPLLFAQAGIALPAGSNSTNSRTGDTSESSNPIPFHTILNLGIKIPLGSSY